MSDIMIPLEIDQLYKMVFNELNQKNSIFGIQRHSFFDPKKHGKLQFRRFGQLLETPLGVAAGPQTQLSQNIIASWLCGARYIELKTVQTLDELHVSKPCIDMEDQGYNCEWSQELRLPQSFKEYLNAWIMIHILREELDLKNEIGELGCIFNMSVGYNLEGIMNKNVQTFFKHMKDCSELKAEAINKLRPLYGKIDKIEIPNRITDNITLSTMHGCPPHEIEKIGMYLLTELKLHTTVKLNPTLNGPEDLRDIVNNKLGYKDVTIPDIAFEHDLKYADGIKLIKNLKEKAKELNLFFGLKLTNTLETINHKNYFDKSNEMMYMSGRPLHATAINIANRLQHEFKGTLDISFSSGADAFNVAPVLACNIKPITMSSDLLKPGGYERLGQYVSKIEEHLVATKSSDIQNLVFTTSGVKNTEESILKNLSDYLPKVLSDKRYHKSSFPWVNIKTDRKLNKFDCIKAPCEGTCPTKQKIPTYMHLAATEQYQKALEVIRESNPFPNSTGMACDHICEDKCSRMNYDDTLLIRDIKRFIASTEKNFAPIKPKRVLNKKVAIIGGGPSGLSAAFYLALEGMQVDVFESKSAIGGMITHALPNFRTIKERVQLDLDRIVSLGVTINENTPIDTQDKVKQLQNEYDYLYFSIGAPKSKTMGIAGENHPQIVGFLKFLEDVKLGRLTTLPSRVAIVGGGNSAIDAVRSAKRLLPANGKVCMIYRRTINEMPANREEIAELLAEKIEVLELTQPKEVVTEEGKLKGLKCVKMQLGAPDKSGRRSPEEVKGSEHLIPLDYVVAAIGQDHSSSFLAGIVDLDKNGKIITNNHKTSHANIFAGGDGVRGPASIIKGIADGKESAFDILTNEGITLEAESNTKKGLTIDEIRKHRTIRTYSEGLPKSHEQNPTNFNVVVQTMTKEQATAEASRCLMCDELCEVCTTVCPNRANASYRTEKREFLLTDLSVVKQQLVATNARTFSITQSQQVFNIGNFCNECGNCALFCPSSGRPYVDKPKVYLTADAFNAENTNAYFFDKATNALRSKEDGVEYILGRQGENYILKVNGNSLLLNHNTLKIEKAIELSQDCQINLEHVAGMAVLFDVIKQKDYLVF